MKIDSVRGNRRPYLCTEILNNEDMRRRFLFLLLSAWVAGAAAQTLEECQQAAEHNYPLIRQYDLIRQTAELTVANIQKGWLPQLSATAQGSYQSDVTAWPSEMRTLMSQMGIDLKGLKKDQYRVGIDVQQTLYDGGSIRSQKEIARRQADLQTAQTEVNLYNVRARVNEMYFALLLIDEQIRLNRDLQTLLEGNEQKLQTMFRHGTAAEGDYKSVRAERLGAAQHLTDLEAQRQTLARMLSVFCGIEVNTTQKPATDSPPEPVMKEHAVLSSWHPKKEGTVNFDGGNSSSSQIQSAPSLQETVGGGTSSSFRHPSLLAFDAQKRLTDAQERALDTALKPRLGLFASGFYGYPGYNLFEDMMHHRWSLNGMIGARLSWNIGALYTRKQDKARLELQRQLTDTNRDVFLFNNRLEQIQENENIQRYRQLMADDDEIINLRRSVRLSAESKLTHGIIDVNDLVKEINAENAAQVQKSIHEIEMLREIYKLKHTTNH